jgi:hypothetical protein
MITVSDYVKLISQCRLERACITQGEPLGGGNGNGGVGGGGQYTANLGPEWTGIRTMIQRRDLQVSKGGFPRGRGRDFQATKRGCQKGVRGMHLYEYIVLIKDCVFRL